MGEIFNSGFTFKSFLNLSKSSVEGIYASGIAAESNKNKEYQTQGLDFYFENDDSINACVFIKNNHDKMYVNTGTIAQLYSLFYSAFSSRNMFVEIGNSSNESHTEVLAAFDFNTKQILLTGEPKDDARRTIANHTSQLAVRYICAHELGHLMDGHAYLLKELYAVDKVEMILKHFLSHVSKKKTLEYALDRRTLEMDADAFAATSSVVNLIGIYNQQENFGYLLNLLEHPLQIFELWAFAVHSIFMQFELSAPSDYSKESYYLPNVARETLNLSAAKITLIEHINRGYFNCTSDTIEKILKYFDRGIGRAEHFFNSYKGTNFNFTSPSTFNKNYHEFTNEVLSHWNNNLRHRLEKYSRALLYNPDGMDY